jgi:hypothetical protein
MITNVNPALIIPDEKSSSQEWITFYQILAKRYGKKAGTVAFVKAWEKFGSDKAQNANVNAIEKGTGLVFDKGLLTSIEGIGGDAVDYVGGFVNSLGTGSKILFYSTIGIAVLLVGGLTIRIITLSAKDAGMIGGTAARAFVTKGK